MTAPTELVVVLCPDCGRIEVAAFEIRLCMRVVPRNGFSSPQFGHAFYGLRCPGCDEYFTREADASVAELLMRAGVLVFTWQAPPELLEVHDGRHFVLDDLIDLHFDIEAMA